MLRLIRYILWGAVIVLGLFLGYQQFFPASKAPKITGLNIEKLAPPLLDIDYTERDWTVVNFFASWCVPCRAEHPLLMKLAAQTTVIGIAWKDQRSDTDAWLAEFGDPFDAVIHDPNDEQSRLWRITGIPASFVIDRKGRIRYRRIGILQEAHAEQIHVLLRTNKQT